MINLNLNRQKILELPKPDAIIFDWDNTLVDTWPLIQIAINKTMKHMNKDPWSLEKVRDTVHKSMRESFPEIFGNDWQKAGEIYKKSYTDINIDNLKLLNNSFELINFIYRKNIPQFLVSNKVGITLRKEVKKLQINELFFSIVGAQDANRDKPNFDPVDFALMSSGIETKKHKIWFIGDTIADVECALNIGAYPIVYGYRNEISKTIETERLKNGNVNNQPLPVYFDHQEIIKQLEKYFL
ncbi:MAG: HAD family hydrolase [Proteobacteria bacterium]|nr:HAD family hydrolase [Pseudomonadota bacterium]NCA27746.1 HAD family hydrolase [Pseudomonadota bacterium]